MQIIHEIDVDGPTHGRIEALRNDACPEYAVARSYYKQLPNLRALQFDGADLVGTMGLDYRAMAVGDAVVKILGVIDFCVAAHARGQGIGSTMLRALIAYATARNVDFVILMADDPRLYARHGFQRVEAHASWLRIHEHKSYGIAFAHIDDLYVKQIGDKAWPDGHVDWLGYMF
jgi:predicted N-acetyltransferase YhbS